MAGSKSATRKSKRPQLRRINGRFVGIILVLCLVVAAGVVLLHRYQLQQVAGQWRQDVQAALQRGEVDQAIQACTRYLTLYPNDTETLEQLGILLDEKAATGAMIQRAYMTFETVLRQDPGRDKVRRRLVDVSIKLGRYKDALTHLEVLRRASAADADLMFKEGICNEESGQFRKAAKLYGEAIVPADAKAQNCRSWLALQT